MHLLCIKNEGKIILKFKNEILGNKMIWKVRNFTVTKNFTLNYK
jgi:hypothetical protein